MGVFLICLCLSIISIALKMLASSLTVAEKVMARADTARIKGNLKKGGNSSSKGVTTVKGAVRGGLTALKLSLRALAFIISRLRDLVSLVGAFVFIMILVVLMVAILSASSLLLLFTDESSGAEEPKTEDKTEVGDKSGYLYDSDTYTVCVNYEEVL